MKCASSSRVPSLGAWRVMLQGVSRRARVAAAELAGTRGDRKMCRETESDDRCRCGMGKTTSSPLFPSLGTSLKVLLPRVPLEFGASPARSRRRLARPTAKRRKLSSDRKYEDVRVVMRTASNQKRLRGKAGHLRLRFRLRVVVLF